jgi:iron complex outermembrane receptor protein
MSSRFIALSFITLPFISTPVFAENTELDTMVVTASRLNDVSALPAHISVITEEEIQSSAANTLPELLSEYAGISINNLFSHGSRANVGIRSFGETATQNTLILLDGRRLNDIDLSSVNYAAIATDNIERIEITRGSGGVLYGDGATTGTINIITKDPRNTENHVLLSQTLGSLDHRETNAFFSYANTQFSLTGNINSLKNDGYRDNNQFRQDTGQLDLRIPVSDAAEIYLKIGAFDQDTELPGERVFNPNTNTDELSSNRTGTNDFNDWADEYTEFATLGFSGNLNPTDSFIIDAGYRQKHQRAMFFDYDGFNSDAYSETKLQTLSLTPRLTLNRSLGQHDLNWIFGADLYLYQYDSKRSNFKQNIGQPVHELAAFQKNIALYSQATIALTHNTNLTAGIRGQKTRLKARDRFDATAPGSAFGSEAADFNESDRKTSFELGLKHHFTNALNIYGRAGRSTRFATIDELFELNALFQQTFSQLKPQVSDDLEVGLGYKGKSLGVNLAFFHQSLKNEIHFNAVTFQNINLDDTQHDGIELAVSLDITPDLTVKANYTHLKAEFTAGDNKGNDLPLIPTNTANIIIIASLPADIQSSVSFNYVDATLLANDLNNNFAKKIPSYKTVDLKLSKQIGSLNLAFKVNNLFNEQYFNYAVGSTFTAGLFNAYPLPERTAYLSASYKFN